MIRIALAEDHNALIDGIRLFIEQEEDIRLVGHANNGRDLCELVRLKKPDVAITDIRMPIMDGIDATRHLLKRDPGIKVIAFTMYDQDDAVKQMLEAGAKGYILKNARLKDLIAAIRTVHAGNTYLDPSLVIPGITPSIKNDTSPLSKRQIDILKLIALGKTNQEIADQLFIGKTTVETHRKNMIRILNLKGAGS